jgi:hypothetical protein
VDKILDAGYVVASKDFLDDSVVCDCSTSAINLYKATFVNKSLDGGNGWETVVLSLKKIFFSSSSYFDGYMCI